MQQLKKPFYIYYLPELISLLILLIYLSPNLLFPGSAHFLVHDNLDSEILWYKMLAQSGLTFASNHTTFNIVYNGIPRGCMPSELDLYSIFNLVFSTITAYNINIVLQHVIAFLGMYLLLSNYIFKGEYRWHTSFLSLAFALLPFWPMGELCVAGQPFVLWAFLNLIHNRKKANSFLVLILFPFYSCHFVYSNLFFIPCIFLFLCVYLYRKKEWNPLPILGFLLLCFLSLLSEYRLILLQFADHIQSQRSGYQSLAGLNWKGYLKTASLLFLRGQYHFYSNQWPLIVLVVLLPTLLIKTIRTSIVPLLIAVCLLVSFIDSFHLFRSSEMLFDKLGPLKSMQLRFITILPTVWHLLFALTILALVKLYPQIKTWALLLIGAQVVLVLFNLNSRDFQNDSFAENAFYYTYIKPNDGNHKSFSAYYSPVLFSDVKNQIKYNNETVLCLQFPSEMAQYSGFHTAAAYMDFFPADKKQELINIFSSELKKAGNIQMQQEITGTRRFQYYCADVGKDSIRNLSLDAAALKTMHIGYVLSTLPITTSTQIGLQYYYGTKTPSGYGEPKQIIVYKVL